jgi:CHRD domain
MRQRLIGTALILCAGLPLLAQSTKTYKARLSPVPIDLSMQATVAGTGSVTATRAGAKLTIAGTFEGLRSPATIAQLHKSPVAGVRGPVIAELTVAKATSGAISGAVDLTPALQQDLDKGRLYVQVHSERAPDGNLWGWLFAPENKR